MTDVQLVVVWVLLVAGSIWFVWLVLDWLAYYAEDLLEILNRRRDDGS